MSDSRGAAAPRASRWGPALAWAAVILVMTSWPSPEIDLRLVHGSDKVAHFGVYFVLGVLTWRAIGAPRASRAWLVAALLLAGFGAVDEWHQRFVPGRDANIWDWTADLTGAVTGLLAAPHLLALARRRQELSS